MRAIMFAPRIESGRVEKKGAKQGFCLLENPSSADVQLNSSPATGDGNLIFLGPIMDG